MKSTKVYYKGVNSRFCSLVATQTPHRIVINSPDSSLGQGIERPSVIIGVANLSYVLWETQFSPLKQPRTLKGQEL